jgi:HEAT repeat protein
MKIGLNAKLGIGIIVVFGLILAGYYSYGPIWWKWQEYRLSSADASTRAEAAETVAAQGKEAIYRAAEWLDSLDENLVIGACEVLEKVKGLNLTELMPEIKRILSGRNSGKTDAAAKLLFNKNVITGDLFERIFYFAEFDYEQDIKEIPVELREIYKSPKCRLNILVYYIRNTPEDESDTIMNDAIQSLERNPLLEANDALVEILKKESAAGKRSSAADSLGQRQDPDSVPYLIYAMNHDASPDVRSSAAKAMFNFLDEQGVFEALNSALVKEKDPYVLQYIIDSLGYTLNENLLGDFVGYLGHYNENVRASALYALYRIIAHDKQSDDINILTYGLSEEKEKKAIMLFARYDLFNKLHKLLSDPYYDVRKISLWLLGLIRDESSFNYILDRLENDTDEVIEAAIIAIRYYKKDRAIEPLVKHLLKAQTTVSYRKMAAEDLHIIGSVKAEKALIEAYLSLWENSAESSEFISEIRGLAASCRLPESEKLILDLAEQEKDHDLLSNANGLFSLTNNSETIRRLYKISLKTCDSNITMAIWNIFRNLSDKNLAPAMMQIFGQFHFGVIKLYIAEYFKKHKITEMCQPLCEMLSDYANEEEKQLIVECLGGIGCSSVVDILDAEYNYASTRDYKCAVLNSLGLIHDSKSCALFFKIAAGSEYDPALRAIAISHITKFDRTASVETLKTIAAVENKSDILAAAVRTMAEIGDNTFYLSLKKIMESDAPGYVRLLAVYALCGLDYGNKADDLGRILFTDEFPDVKKIAAEELGRLGGNASFTALTDFLDAYCRGDKRITERSSDELLAAVVKSLENIGDVKAVNHLNNLLDKEISSDVAEPLVQTLLEFNDNSSISHLVGFLGRIIDKDDYSFPDSLILALAYHNPPGLMEILEKAINKYEDDQVPGYDSATALGIIGNERALNILAVRLEKLKNGGDLAAHIAMALGKNKRKSAFGAIKDLFQSGKNHIALDYIPSFGGIRVACAYAITMLEIENPDSLCNENYFRRNKAARNVLAWFKGGKRIKIEPVEDRESESSSWRLANIKWGYLKEMKSFFDTPDGWCGGPKDYEQLIHYEYFYRDLFAMMPQGFPPVDFRAGLAGLKKKAAEIGDWVEENKVRLAWDTEKRKYYLKPDGAGK